MQRANINENTIHNLYAAIHKNVFITMDMSKIVISMSAVNFANHFLVVVLQLNVY